jgi:hypothetical protein
MSTSAAKAALRQCICGTAEAVPLSKTGFVPLRGVIALHDKQNGLFSRSLTRREHQVQPNTLVQLFRLSSSGIIVAGMSIRKGPESASEHGLEQIS